MRPYVSSTQIRKSLKAERQADKITISVCVCVRVCVCVCLEHDVLFQCVGKSNAEMITICLMFVSVYLDGLCVCVCVCVCV